MTREQMYELIGKIMDSLNLDDDVTFNKLEDALDIFFNYPDYGNYN